MPQPRELQLVVQTAFLGDLFLSIGLLKALREKHPNRALGLMCRQNLGDFFLRTGLVDHIFEIKKGDAESYRKMRDQIAEFSKVYVYSPHSSFRTAFFVRSLNPTDSVGFLKALTAWAYKRTVKRPDALPDVLRQMALLAPEDEILAENLKQYGNSNRAYLRDENGRLSGVPAWASISVRKILEDDKTSWMKLMEKLNWSQWDGKNKILIFPGSVWATKRWTEEGFVEVGKTLTEMGHQVLVMGAGNEVALAERVAAQIPGAVSLAGKTDLYESALVLVNADMMIGNDSASAHLAAAAETPSVNIFGPTVIEQGFRPWSDAAHIADKPGLACRPCGPHGHNKCPRGTHECMRNLSSSDILKKAVHLIP